MKIIKITAFILVASAAASLLASAPKNSDSKLSKAEIMEKFRQARAKNRVETGGIVYSLPAGKVIEVINRQNVVPQSSLDAAAASVKYHSILPVNFVVEKSANAGIVIEITNEGSAPVILAAPDNGWAKLNVARLLEDNPTEAKINERVVKQFWRTLGASMGVGVSAFQPCLMRNMATLKDLDRCKSDRPGPSTLNSINESAVFFGVQPLKVASYMKACQEGWAPAPTNDIQKAIWDKVRATPKNPMKIEFDPKKGR